MPNAIYLPHPYEDETFPSVLHRYRKSMRVGNMLNLEMRISNTYNLPVANIVRPSLVAEMTRDCWGWSTEKLIDRFSLLPFFSCFISEDRLREKTALRSEDAVYLASSRTINHNYLRYCEVCFTEDRKAGREQYWRLSHQIPGIFYCHSHHAPLWEIEATRQVLSKLTPDERVASGQQKIFEQSASQRSRAVEVAMRCHQYLTSPIAFDRNDLTRRWRHIAISHPCFAAKCGGFRREPLTEALIEFYGDEYTQALDNRVRRKRAKAPILSGSTLLKQLKFAGAPMLVHLQIFFEWLDSKPREVPPSVRPELPLCPNRFAGHAPGHRVNVVSIPDEAGVRSAACTCGMFFLFSGIEEGIPQNVRIRRAGPAIRREALRLFKDGASLAAISRQLGLGSSIAFHWAHGKELAGDEEKILGLCRIEERFKEALRTHGSPAAVFRANETMRAQVRRYAPHLLKKT